MRYGLVVGVFVVGVVGCGGREPSFLKPEARAAARVQVAAADCPGRPKIVTAPGHCVFETDPSSRVLRVDVDLAAEVDANGAARGVKLAGPSAGEDADRAAIKCALQAKYAAGQDESGGVVGGETCPFRIRLARYPTDVAPRATLTCGPTESSFMAYGPSARPCSVP